MQSLVPKQRNCTTTQRNYCNRSSMKTGSLLQVLQVFGRQQELQPIRSKYKTTRQLFISNAYVSRSRKQQASQIFRSLISSLQRRIILAHSAFQFQELKNTS